jgi:hypothetical protein
VFNFDLLSLFLRVSYCNPELTILIPNWIKETGKAMIESKFVLVLAILATSFFSGLESKCPKTCDLALGSYFVSNASSIGGLSLNLSYIASLFGMTAEETLPYNPTLNKDFIQVCVAHISSLSHCYIYRESKHTVSLNLHLGIS